MGYIINPLVGWLLSHAYGQGGTVAVPSSDQPAFDVPKGEFPPGIDDVLLRLSQRFRSWRAGDDVDWCFLVGGPGNGKSESLRTLAQKLDIKLSPKVVGDPVSRVVPTGWPLVAQQLPSGLEVAFINDASIPRSDASGPGKPGSLFLDASDALRRFLVGHAPAALFANVNRGILIEEDGGLGSGHASLFTTEGRFASELIRWLAKPPADAGASNVALKTTVAVDPSSPHYGQCVLTVGGNNIVVHAIFLDVLSLLEPRPGAGGAAVDFSVDPPSVAKYRTLGSLLSTDVTRDETTAGRLVDDFVKLGRWSGGACRDVTTGNLCEAHQTCPFAQNALWLQEASLRHRFLDAMRGAEVAAGRRFTYRDLLGHISLAMLGQPEEAWLEGEHPCKWSRDQHLAVTRGVQRAVVALQSHRIYTNLFGNVFSDSQRLTERELTGDTIYGAMKLRRAASGEAPRVQAFERAFKEIDPARDTDSWTSVRTTVLDAVESLDVQSPSEQALQWPQVPAKAHSEIETLLDHALREEIASELARGSQAASHRVRALRRWRSILMLRQIGLALGHLNFGIAIQAWLVEQENALRSGQRMKLGDGLYYLIIPVRTAGHVFFAPLRPRTYCLSELPVDTLLVSVATTDLALVVLSHGDTLVAEVQLNRARERPLPLAGFVIDLAVAREALLHKDGDARSFTEIGYTAFARIERARASLISRERMVAMPVHFTDSSGQLFKVSQNPSGPVPLRVQRA